MNQSAADVLIVGAGPTGLTAASELVRHGLSVRVIDSKASPSGLSKALVLHARTMEVFESMGMVDRVLDAGERFVALNVHTHAKRPPVRIDLLKRNWHDTRYPFWFSIPQCETERCLAEHLESMGVRVEWGTELREISQDGNGVSARVTDASGSSQELQAGWLLGCDGSQSRTRELTGIEMDYRPYGIEFALADARADVDLGTGEGHVFPTKQGALMIAPTPTQGLFRLIAHVEKGTQLGIADWVKLVFERTGLVFDIQDLAWHSHFRLGHGLAQRYRHERIFLLGDAAHVQSPVGGQGLNTGIQDAHDLAWRLATDKRAGGAGKILDGYTTERRPFAERVIRYTSRATRMLAAPRGIRPLRNKLARRFLGFTVLQERFGRGVGMLDSRCGGSETLGDFSRPWVGRRLPNPLLWNGQRLHDRIDDLRHTAVDFDVVDDLDVAAPWLGPGLRFGEGGLPDPGGVVAGALGARPGERWLVRPDRIVAAIGEPHVLEAKFLREIGCPVAAL